MSISRQNLSIVIVTFKSENVIHQCLESIDKEIPIIVVENSNNIEFKNNLEKKYKNIQCVLSGENLGMGTANNLGITLSKTDYVLILNPDVVLEQNTLHELMIASEEINDFAIISPVSKNIEHPNYKILNNYQEKNNQNLPFNVKSVDGYAMLFNKKIMQEINIQENTHNNKYFDENFFLYLENDDLCKRVIEKKKNIFVVPKSKINHLGASAVDKKHNYEVELSRNWHWIWSKFYFNKKHVGFFKAFFDGFPGFFLSIFKVFFYFLVNKKFKRKIYLNRAQGFLNALIGKSSWYRPNIK